MRQFLRAAVLALVPTMAAAQDRVIPVPPTVKAEGLPPIPQSIADDLSKYTSGMPLGYRIQWATYDNSLGAATKLPAALGRKLPAVNSGTSYLAATIACQNGADGGCPSAVTVYLRRSGGGFEVVGSER